MPTWGIFECVRIRPVYWLFLLFVVLVTLSCWWDTGSSGSSITVQARRTFNAQTLFRTWVQVDSDLRYTGKHCLVYVEEGESSKIPDPVIAEIGQAFDSKAYPIVTQYFGEPYDVDGNGKVILLLLDIQDGYTEGDGGYVAGYFDSTHMLSTSTFSRSNQADMIFLDTYPGLRTVSGEIDPAAKEDLKLTLAHEFQHLVNYSEKVIRQRRSPQDTWINEGLSAAVEYLYLGKHVQWKIDYFNQVQYQTTQGKTYNPLSDSNLWGQYFVSWGRWGDPLVNYSTVYLFFQWLRIQAGSTSNGNPEIYRSILQDPASDYQAVVHAFNFHTRDILEDIPGGGSWTWKGIFRSWLLANLLNQPSGWYGYKHQLTDDQGKVKYLYPRFFVNLPSDGAKIYSRGAYPPFSVTGSTAGQAFLLPGDAVYVKLAGEFNITESETDTIAYGGVTLPGQEPRVGTGTYQSGEILLAGNAKGVFDGYVYSTSSLLTPGAQGNETIVDISSLSPPAPDAGWIPKGYDTTRGTTGKGPIRTPRRPLPMDALLGDSSIESRELPR